MIVHLPHALVQIARTTARVSVFSALVFFLIWLCERHLGRRTDRYKSHNFAHDLLYWFYYETGIHAALFQGLVYAALSLPLGFLRLDLGAGLPAPVRYLMFWVLADFLNYWFHRLKHSSPYLWAFHSVHHSQEILTAPTLTRGHPVESVLGAAVFFIPLQIVGVPPGLWLPLALLRQFLESCQHSDLPWTFGPFYRVIVSPKFHAFHHSANPEDYNCNFGFNLSVWDFLFGTSVTRETAPSVYGVPGLRMDTLRSQMLTPFSLLRQALHRGGD